MKKFLDGNGLLYLLGLLLSGLEIPYETAAMLLAGNEPRGEAEDGEMSYSEARAILAGNETPGEAEDGEIPYWLAKQILCGGAE